MARSSPLEKKRRAAADPDRPGLRCSAPPGTWSHVVDLRRCEGERACVDVCPNDVFEVRRIDDADFASLGFVGRLRSRAHGRLAAYTPNDDSCRACGLCVVACPEDAISLVGPG
jgi:NAD-dependent dihydropyrimidine dehydrogenase PreA subunit